MNFTLHQLRIFYTISKTLSISKAAEELNLTQPAVSIQQKNFQSEFELALMHLKGKKIVLTDFGKDIAKLAERILNDADQLKSRIDDHKGLIAGKLKIAVVSTGKYLMPYLLTDFLNIYPGVELIMEVANEDAVKQQLKDWHYELALMSLADLEPEYGALDLLENKIYLFKNSQLKMNDLNEIFEKYPVIIREEGSGTRGISENFIRDINLPLKIKKMVLTSNEAVKQALLAQLGVSIMPLIGLKNEINNHLVTIIPHEGFPIKNQWKLVWLKERELTNVAKKYIAYLQNNLEMLIEKHFEWYRLFEQHNLSNKPLQTSEK